MSSAPQLKTKASRWEAYALDSWDDFVVEEIELLSDELISYGAVLVAEGHSLKTIVGLMRERNFFSVFPLCKEDIDEHVKMVIEAGIEFHQQRLTTFGPEAEEIMAEVQWLLK